MKFELDNMFISVKEAADLTGKSATTIYRLCNKRINTEYVRKEDNKFLINREFLMATYPQDELEEVVELEEDVPEMRFENVTKENKQTDFEEKPVTLENIEIPANNRNNKNDKKELNAGVTIEFEEKTEKSYFQQISSKEALIGLAISLGGISIFIYLLFKIYN